MFLGRKSKNRGQIQSENFFLFAPHPKILDKFFSRIRKVPENP